MTLQQIITELNTLISSYETKIAELNAQIDVLKANQLPTGIVDITITGINKSQVTFS